ncbi:uncharacterized protein LOC119575901 [Penaeus monodon]|uniref:uncharacterized protein LOC119575901 n=1 Tax=Penaeus monodon TaxID=6687 RepID=UPI0018A6F450|nr:uncharacterized protein LOC119575901 [Penaeus monodon]
MKDASDYTGTFLQGTHLEPFKVVLFVNHWLQKHWDHETVIKCIGISKTSSVGWSFCSEVTQNWLQNQNSIGGAGVIVEIDETLLVRRKYNRGRQLSQDLPEVNIVETYINYIRFHKYGYPNLFYFEKWALVANAEAISNYFSYALVRDELKLSGKTICDWGSFCHEVLIAWCLNSSAEKIGGPGTIVEIDESKFGKRKYNVGRLIEGQWVFGGVCRESRIFFFIPVPSRYAETLLEVIKDRIKEGTTIISDSWKAYNCLDKEGFQHLTVNHSHNFVDPVTAAHTNTIERKWREAAKVPHYAGGSIILSFICAMFLMSIPDSNQRLHRFLLAAADLYPPQ